MVRNSIFVSFLPMITLTMGTVVKSPTPQSNAQLIPPEPSSLSLFFGKFDVFSALHCGLVNKRQFPLPFLQATQIQAQSLSQVKFHTVPADDVLTICTDYPSKYSVREKVADTDFAVPARKRDQASSSRPVSPPSAEKGKNKAETNGGVKQILKDFEDEMTCPM